LDLEKPRRWTLW